MTPTPGAKAVLLLALFFIAGCARCRCVGTMKSDDPRVHPIGVGGLQIEN